MNPISENTQTSLQQQGAEELAEVWRQVQVALGALLER
jgi:hypothetical protein